MLTDVVKTFVGSAALVCLTATGSSAQPGGVFPSADDRLGRLTRAVSGSIEGVVLDESGGPLAGATVTALGATSASTMTDLRGRYVLRMLPPGAYLVRAQAEGFLPSRRQLVDVRPNVYARHVVALQRASLGVSAGARARADDPTLMAAALYRPPAVQEPDLAGDLPAGASGSDDRSETAWRLRHLKRTVLKDTDERTRRGGARGDALVASADDLQPARSRDRLFGDAMRLTTSFFESLPITGEVNFLTTGSFGDPLGLFAPDNLAGTATYVTLRGPASQHGDWSASLVMSQADVGSYFLSGSYRSRGRHVFEVGASYNLLRGTTDPAGRSLSNETAWSRSAGLVFGTDQWTILPSLLVSYGGGYARYDYLPGLGFFSPKATVTLVPTSTLRVNTTFSRSVVAPGADEFLQPLAESLWVPPSHSFVSWSAARMPAAERVQHAEVSIEHDLSPAQVVTFRTFMQRVTDQQAMLFDATGVNTIGNESGEYAVATAGDLLVRGWGIGLSNAFSAYVRGSIRYAMTRSVWLAPDEAPRTTALMNGNGRAGIERLHDLTTSIETDIPQTDTHVFVVYRINTGFARRDADTLRPGFDSRFDLQVTQRLPFLDFSSAQWQLLFAVRNLFREGDEVSSLYDELLVVRPPKRIVGGVLVRF